MLLENYTEFFSKVKQKPKDSVEDAKKWLLGDLVVKDFQVMFPPSVVIFIFYSSLESTHPEILKKWIKNGYEITLRK